MRALCWHGVGDIRCDTVPDPRIEHPRDAVVKVSSCAICGSDLHLMDGLIPTMESGDVLGHETMGEVVEVGAENKKLKVGDRVIVPFTICCGECFQCKRGNWSCCERSNPNAEMAAKMYGHTAAGLFGYSHLTGGFPGGQAEYVRVPYADVAPMKVPEGLSDEQVLFLTDIFPTAWQACDHCEITPDDTVAIWGAGPVGLLAIKCAKIMGAKQVVAIEDVPERIALARNAGADAVIDFTEENVKERLNDLTDGRGPDAVIDAVGMEAHGSGGITGVISAVKETMTRSERPYALEQALLMCRPGGIVSVPGVYGAFLTINFGAIMQKGLTVKTGQTHVPRYLEKLMRLIQEGEIDPSFIITHRAGLEQGPELYKTFRDKKDGCVKVVLRP
jgi:threonine dehydrogenase-like Zn-dependent dehydrogenase